MSSTACWNWDTRTPPASPEPQAGLGAARLSHRSLQQRLLRRTDRWRVSLTIADGEMAAWTARGAQL